MYDNAALQGAIAAPRVTPELGRLKAATERVAAASEKIEKFLYRFSGPRGGGVADSTVQPPDSYRNDIDSLFNQLAILEDCASALDAIG